MFPWILGAKVNTHEVFAIIILVISVLSWLVNLIQGNSPNGAQSRPLKPNAKPKSSRSELEELIHELTTDKRKAEQRTTPPPAAKPRAERPRPPATTVPQRPGSPPPYSPSRPTPQVAEPKRPAAKRTAAALGEGIRGHHVGNRIEAPVQQSIAPAVLPNTDNGSNRSGVATSVQEKPVSPLTKLLREPDGIRQALILNEILQRPKSLRR